jgi:hypothetical protein
MKLKIQGLELLPPTMNTLQARAMLYAIGLQESNFMNRRQIGGTARGFWQFEQGGGVAGVMRHPYTYVHVSNVCKALLVPLLANDIYEAIAWNDSLAACFARLLLYTWPHALPTDTEPDEGWRQYITLWRPGFPRPESWKNNYLNGWKLVKEEL